MSEVDDRIVSIQFDNASFERRIETTLRSLEKLSESLRFSDSQKGINKVSNAVNSFDPSHMSNAIDGIAKRFSTMGIVGAAAIANLTFGALNFAKKVGGDILSPILGGGKSRAINLEQAKFLFEGIGIDVKQGMDSALKAVKGTAFGLDEAAKIAAQFGASGIKAGDQMTSALRGVAGVAALTGTSFSEIGDIFASSAGTGVVNNQDLLQFATRGLNAADAVGKQLGITQQQVHEMASAGKLDFKTFADAMDKAFGKHATEANKTYTGSLANLHAAFSRLGASVFTPHLQQQRDLFNALTPVIDNIAEALLPLINDFILFKAILNNNLINRLKNLDTKTFKKGVENLGIAFINLYQAFKPVIVVFRRAFAEIFSGSAGKSFVSLTNSFKNFTAGIKIGADTLQKIKSIFRGFFAAIEIGFAIVKGIVGVIGDVLHALLPAGKGLLNFGDSTGGFLVNLNKALVAGGGIKRFFEELSSVLTHPIESFNRLKDAVVAFFHGINFSASGPIKFLQDLRDKLFNFFNIHVNDAASQGLSRVSQRLQQVHDVWDKVQTAFTNVHDFLRPILTYMTNWFKSLGHKIAAAFHPGDFNSVLDIINVGLLGGIAVLIKKFADGGITSLLGNNFVDKIKGVFDGLTNTLKTMQAKVKSDILIRIAEAVAILVAALLVLSLIDSKALTKALVALSVSFGQLIGVMVALDKINFSTNVLKLNGMAAAMILIAGAAITLSIAITILARLDLGSLAKGLGGVAVGLGLLVASTRLIASNTAGLISAGLAMIVISTSLIILSKAVKLFAQMSAGELAKGMLAVGIALKGLVTALNSISSDTSGLFSASLAIIAISGALIILNKAVKLFAAMSFGEMAKGFLGIALGMTALIVAMNFISTESAGLIVASFAMIAISIAMNIMARAIAKMGNMDFGVLAKGIGALAAVLLILVVATNAMSGAAGGAIAIFIVAGALKVLAEVLVVLGGLSLGQLGIALLAIVGVLAVLGIAAAALSPVIGNLLALGIALGLLGAAFALFGVGAALIAKAFEIMANSGAAGAKGIVDALKVIITALPSVEKALFDFAVNFAKDILKAAPLLLRLFEAFVTQLLETVVHLAPKMAIAAVVVIKSFLAAVRAIFPDVIQTGIEMLLTFLQGVRDNIGEIVTVATEIMINFMDAIVANLPQLATHAVELITTFIGEIGRHAGELVAAGLGLLVNILKGIADNIDRVVGAVTSIITKFIESVGTHYLEILNSGIKVLTDFLKGIGDNLVKIVATVGDVIARFILEIGNNAQKIINAGADMIVKFFNGLGSKIPKVLKALKDAVFAVIRSLRDEILTRENVAFVVSAAIDMVTALFNGMADALDSRAGELGRAIGHFAGSLAKAFGTVFREAVKEGAKQVVPLPDLTTPSRDVAPGAPPKPNSGDTKNVASGPPVARTAAFVSNDANVLVSNFSKALSKVPDIIEGMSEFSPTITPVLDLSRVQAASGDIAGFMTVPEITPDVSFDQARVISSTKQDVGADVPTPEPSVVNNTFEQTINAPTPLSTNDIYKNTKSQFALAKEKLGVG